MGTEQQQPKKESENERIRRIVKEIREMTIEEKREIIARYRREKSED